VVESVWFWSLTTLGVGLIVGYASQRSGFCTIGGWRDFILMRDTYLLKGVLGFLVGGIAGYTILTLAGGIYYANQFPWFYFKNWAMIPGTVVVYKNLWVGWAIATLGGLGMGFFSVLAGGCPLRNATMASEGNKSSWWYLLGFVLVIPIVIYLFTFINPLGWF
jgi:uncharacterized membrane protein YedE/YeeE